MEDPEVRLAWMPANSKSKDRPIKDEIVQTEWKKLFNRAKDSLTFSLDSGADEMRHERMNGHDQE